MKTKIVFITTGVITLIGVLLMLGMTAELGDTLYDTVYVANSSIFQESHSIYVKQNDVSMEKVKYKTGVVVSLSDDSVFLSSGDTIKTNVLSQKVSIGDSIYIYIPNIQKYYSNGIPHLNVITATLPFDRIERDLQLGVNTDALDKMFPNILSENKYWIYGTEAERNKIAEKVDKVNAFSPKVANTGIEVSVVDKGDFIQEKQLGSLHVVKVRPLYGGAWFYTILCVVLLSFLVFMVLLGSNLLE